MYIINNIYIISPQTWGLSNLSILFFEYLTIFRTNKAVFIYMNNLNFDDYEEKSEKKGFQLQIYITFYFCNKQCVYNMCACLNFCKRKV